MPLGDAVRVLYRRGRRILTAALEAEVNQYMAELADPRDERGRRLVVRNGHHREQTVTTAAGPVEVRAPRVNDRRVEGATGQRQRFSSQIPASWCRKSPEISEVLPLPHLHGLSSGDFVLALGQFLGSSAGLSSATVTRLTKQWREDHTAFQERDLSVSDYVHVWAYGVHPKVRLGQAHSCVLVLMGMRVDGTKELIAIAEGLRESAESWADLLRDCRRRGLRGPELVVGDGAMGLWKAPAPGRAAGAAGDLVRSFTVEKVDSIAMVFKLVESAQERWRAITAPHLVALVRNGARFENGQRSTAQPTDRQVREIVQPPLGPDTCRHLSSTFTSRLMTNCLCTPSTNAVPRDERSHQPDQPPAHTASHPRQASSRHSQNLPSKARSN
ncbi:transposase [Streptomyces atratus]|uniref:transposase n=1 Tax=Streptomyces atratus TaxID=1893 RepID=UPI003570AC33